jgi:hypothetical protein
MREADRTAILPAHIEETVQAIAKLHAEHQERATPFHKFTEGRRRPLDQPPFTGLELAVSLAALFVTVLILRRNVATTNWPATASN